MNQALIPDFIQRADGEILIRHFDFLKAHYVGFESFKPLQQAIQTHSDRIDIPRAD
jgi:hypothetical protein